MTPVETSQSGPEQGIYGLAFTPEESRVVLVPVPWEATVSHGSGTAGAPAAILAASQQVDLQDRETGRPHEAGIAMLPVPEHVWERSRAARRRALPVIEADGPGDDADLARAADDVNAACEWMNGWVREQVTLWLGAGKIVGVVGGDHSVSYGAICAVAERHPGLGILHIDAHADLRQTYQGLRWSHACVMGNVVQDVAGVSRFVQVGVRDYCDEEAAVIERQPDRLRTYFDADLRRQIHDGGSWGPIAGRLVADLPAQVYVSLDIDGLDPSLCPHTGTPVPGGLSFAEVSTLLRCVAESDRRIVGFDLTEVAPEAGGHSDWDASVGARMLYKQIGFALR